MGAPHGPNSPDSALLFEETIGNPYNISENRQDLAPVWENSDDLRSLLANKRNPTVDERGRLGGFLNYQLNTLWLYWKLVQWRHATARGATDVTEAALYVLLFPGEAKDNTGIKDLNDKVLGYWLNSQFIRRRQVAIGEIFNAAVSKFEPAAQTYKSAYIFTFDGTRREFEKRLELLDAKLREILIEILKTAQHDPDLDKESDRAKAIAKLLKKLEGNKNYKFDIFFGFRRVTLGNDDLENVFLLVTEALKGAGMGRFIAKRKTSKRLVRNSTARIDRDKKTDARGKEYAWKTFMKASGVAEQIKNVFTGGYTTKMPYDFQPVYIDRVWTISFLEHKKLHVGNPDVIRDVRKKKLERPRARDGNIVYTFNAQKDFLELWLVTLNMLDFVKRFKADEFKKAVLAYHQDAREALLEVGNETRTLDWNRLERILTNDVRQSGPIAQYESASEFLFYAYAADSSARIFFNMDVRDMGVELLLSYENSNRLIGFNKYEDADLMEETLRATDVIDERRRHTYDRVVDVFRKYHALVTKNVASAKVASRAAFGNEVEGLDKLPAFADAVQFMLGGDEIFVAAHPLFTKYVHNIVADLDAMTREHPFEDRTLDLRVGVAYSAADLDKESQRRKNKEAHQDAMVIADAASAVLKPWERSHRRIERLIEMLEANDAKATKAPPYRVALENLGLMKLFGRGKRKEAARLTPPRMRKLLRLIRTEELHRDQVSKYIELVDFDGNVVSEQKLQQATENLEQLVVKDVGKDNTRQQVPPLHEAPKWLKKVLDCWEDPDKCFKKKKSGSAGP